MCKYFKKATSLDHYHLSKHVIDDLLEQIFNEGWTWWEEAQTVGHKKPASFIVGIISVEPGLVTKLSKDLISQNVIG